MKIEISESTLRILRKIEANYERADIETLVAEAIAQGSPRVVAIASRGFYGPVRGVGIEYGKREKDNAV